MTGDLSELEAALQAAVDRKKFHRLAFYQPYPKQQEFHDMGIAKRERCLFAGNQNGKTYCGGAEAAMHLTGEYPDWWMGARCEPPVEAWVAGESAEATRDLLQAQLCGPPAVEAEWGSGWIPKETWIGRPSMRRGVADAFDTLAVRHKSGATSLATFKSYEQGRGKWQGRKLSFIWLDEEPPADIYTEAQARTIASGGFSFMTFTPLQGISAVVARFTNDDEPTRGTVYMTIDDAEHISPERKREEIARMQPHEREARAFGRPLLGSGRIYLTPEQNLIWTPPSFAEIPISWAKGWGVDFGIAHPFAAVLMAWDRDADTLYVLNAIRIADGNPTMHAKAINSVAFGIPIAWPHDGHKRQEGANGEEIAAVYRAEGLPLLGQHSTHPEGGYGVEAGLLELDGRMRTARFRVSSHLTDWWEEYRLYHRKDGVIHKERDDLMDATRTGAMMKRFWKPLPIGPKVGAGMRRDRGRQTYASGIDFDPFSGS